MKNAKKNLVKITTQKITEKEAFELYSDLINPDVDVLKKSKSKDKDRRHNILNVLKNLKSLFTGVYLNYSNKPSEDCMTERTILKRQRSDEVAKKEMMIVAKSFREYFEYLIPSDMYNNLIKAIGSEENKAQVNAIKDR